MLKLGIDLGGTKIEGAAVREDGSVCFRKRIPTEQDRGYAHVLDRIVAMHGMLMDQAGDESTTFGIGTPGALSLKTGRLKNSNTQCLLDQPIREDLEKRLGRPVAIQNDANCFAMAEALYGAGRGKDVVFGVIMGTGCGGGIVVNGHVLTGLQAIAGEWGHMSIDPAGPPCYCGMRGCVETLISGGGLEQRYRERFGTKKALPRIVEAYRNNDADAQAFMQTFFAHFGRAMANLITILDPDCVVLGGGVSNIDELYSLGLDQVRRYAFHEHVETPILKHQLGDSAGVIGAAWTGR